MLRSAGDSACRGWQSEIGEQLRVFHMPGSSPVERCGLGFDSRPWPLCLCIQVSQEECAILREDVPNVKIHRYNPKHLYPKLNGYGDNGQRSLKL